MAVAGFVCGLVAGICSILFGATFPMIGLCISVPAIVLSAIGLKKENKKQMCVCGLAFGIITSIYFLVFLIINLITLILLLLSLTKIN